MKPRQMIKGEMACAYTLLVVSLLAFAAALLLFLENPGVATQGTFPLAASSVMVLSSLVMVGEMKCLSPSFAEEEKENRFMKTLRFLFPDKMAPVMLLIVVYAVMLPYVGFMIATAAFLFLIMMLLKAGKWSHCVLISAGIVAGIMIIFQFIFHVVLP
ncbi:MAG: tripartite tricarboxylate transporter TctB family protein [Brotaphodocola sp.]